MLNTKSYTNKMATKEENVRHFLSLIKRSQRGAFKIYIGMIAGVGKTYKMLQEGKHSLNYRY